MKTISQTLKKRLRPEQIFMLSGLLVNGGNYLYNLVLGRFLGPAQFADAALLITLLLVLSFVAMTFQLGMTRFVAQQEGQKQHAYIKWIWKKAMNFGLLLGVLLVVFSNTFQQVFKTESSIIFIIFGVSIPIYFMMSTRRGIQQGNQDFVGLSGSYQLEMLARLLCTFLFVMIWQEQPLLGVVLGIGISFLAGLFAKKDRIKIIKPQLALSTQEKAKVRIFLLLTALYEGAQIVCNNSDILLVKHFFPSQEAGLYASLALIGRVVYFITWMFVMLLLPKVVELKKRGVSTVGVLHNYLSITGGLAIFLVVLCFLAPEFIVSSFFGSEYISIAPLLGWYALATALFSVSNVFAYYFMSLDRYVPIVISVLFGLIQIFSIFIFHATLFEVIMVQVWVMGTLLLLQYLHYRWQNSKFVKSFI